MYKYVYNLHNHNSTVSVKIHKKAPKTKASNQTKIRLTFNSKNFGSTII